MPNLGTILDSPIDWTLFKNDPAVEEFLNDLQANILKGHGRDHTANIFLGFAGMSKDAVAALIRVLGAQCTSALSQLCTNKRVSPLNDGGTVRCLFLSASGYKALGSLAGTTPGGAAFGKGMEQSRVALADPPRNQWSPVWSGAAPDAMLLIADSSEAAVDADLLAAHRWIGGTGAKVLFEERGLQQFRTFSPGAEREGVEHFGYVDGRSQPLILTQDMAGPANAGGETHAKWDPRFKPSQFVVPDPNGRRLCSAGSYFVFRKLEQNVKDFNAAETQVAKTYFGNHPTDDQKDRAGAWIVGRFEDGTPVVSADAEAKLPPPNDFDYADDPAGAECPFHAHIRKVNPREDGARKPLMIRRGITYGEQRPMKDGDFDDEGNEPVHDSGLLFMAYMASIEDQFEFTQKLWANNAGFQHPGTGLDPVIGQGQRGDLTFQDGKTAPKKKIGFDQFVHMKGGEYFFAPSLSFIRTVGI